MAELSSTEVQQLVNAMQSLTKSMGVVASGVVGNSSGRSTRSNDSLSSARKTLKMDFTGVRKFNETAGKSSDSIRRFARNTDSASAAMEKFGTLAKFFVGGFIIDQMLDYGRSTIDTYRRMTEVGQTFSGSILEMSRAAATAGLPLSDFAELIQKNSEVAAVFGQKRLAELAKTVRQTSEQFGMYGMTIDQLNEFTGDYMKTMRSYGILETLDRHQAANSIQELAGQTSGLAVTFGTSRQKIMQETQRVLQDASVVGRMMTLQGGSAQRYSDALQKATAFMAAQPGKAGEVFSRMMSETFGRGAAILGSDRDTFVKAGMSETLGMFDTLRQKIENGGINDDDLAIFNNDFLDAVERNAHSLRHQEMAGNQSAREILQMASGMRRLSAEEMRKNRIEAQRRDGMTKFFSSIQNVINRAFGAFLDNEKGGGFLAALGDINAKFEAFTDSPSFQRFSDYLTEMGDNLGQVVSAFLSNPEEKAAIINDSLKGMSRVGTDIMEIVRSLSSDESKEKIKEWIAGLDGSIKKVQEWIKEIDGWVTYFKGSEGQSALITAGIVAAGTAAVTAAVPLILSALLRGLITGVLGSFFRSYTVTAGVVNVTGGAGGIDLDGPGGRGGPRINAAAALAGRAVGAVGAGYAAHETIKAFDPNDSIGGFINRNIPGASIVDNWASYIGLGQDFETQARQQLALGHDIPEHIKNRLSEDARRRLIPAETAVAATPSVTTESMDIQLFKRTEELSDRIERQRQQLEESLTKAQLSPQYERMMQPMIDTMTRSFGAMLNELEKQNEIARQQHSTMRTIADNQ